MGSIFRFGVALALDARHFVHRSIVDLPPPPPFLYMVANGIANSNEEEAAHCERGAPSGYSGLSSPTCCSNLPYGWYPYPQSYPRTP